MANSEYEHALQHLREKHVRLTPQRKLILHYLINHHTHPSVEMIYADLKQEADNISMATIYNTINLLVEDQLVIELKMVMAAPIMTTLGTPTTMSSVTTAV